MTDKQQEYNDKELLSHLQDPTLRIKAFSYIVKRYSEPLYWHIRRMVLTHDDSDDLLQNTFIKAWSNIENFRGESQISTWLFRIAINETLTFLGHKNMETVSLSHTDGIIAEQLESDTYFNGDHADALFHEAVQRLPEKQRLVFNMKYFDNMKYSEISEILGTSIGALKASYHIAVKKIESYLTENN